MGAADTPLCGAKTRDGGTCRRQAMKNGRCYRHGGKSTGPKTWRAGGKYSQKMQSFLAACKDRALDPALLDAREKLATLDEVIDDLAERAVEERDSPQFRKAAVDRAKEAYDLLLAGDPGVQRAMRGLYNFLRRGVERDRALLNVAALSEKRIAKTVDIRRVMVTESNAISLQQMEDFARMTFETIMKVAGNEIGPAIVTSITDAWHGRETHPAWRERLALVEDGQGSTEPDA